MRLLMIAVAVCTVTGCSGTGGGGGAAGAGSSAIVVPGAELSGSLLDGLRTRVRSMRIESGPGCPRIIFRGQRSVQAQGDPSVYLDGTLMSDTCILSQISTTDIDFVEVYPGGNVSRPGIQRNPFGTILIFRLRR